MHPQAKQCTPISHPYGNANAVQKSEATCMTTVQDKNVRPRPAAGVPYQHARVRDQARRAPRLQRSHAAPHLRLLTDDSPSAAAAILDERTRIARELHDTVAQTLYAITLSASRALKLVEQGDVAPLQGLVEDVIKLANDGQAELRAMLSAFRSELFIEQGLIGALTGVAADAQTRYGLNVQLALSDEPEISPAAKEALVRIAQEALHNVAKHAEADRVDLVLNVGSGNDVVLLITDTGRGFDLQLPRPGHFGLQSMRERAKAAGGSLDLISAVGYGTLLRVRVPRLA